MTENIKPGSVILIGIDPFDGKPTPEPEIFGSERSAAEAIHNDAVSYDVFEAIRLSEYGTWVSCWGSIEWYLGGDGE